MFMAIKVGQSALELVSQFPRIFPKIEIYTFSKYSPAPGLEDRLQSKMNPSLTSLFDDATRLRIGNNEMPYWESILLSAKNSSDIKVIMKEAIRHEATPKNHRVSVSNKAISFDQLLLNQLSLPKHHALSICSLVKKKNSDERFHLPIMDMRCKPTAANLEKCKYAFNHLGFPGIILNSGKSYHYYGLKILSQEEWVSFMGKCLLLTPLSDVRYVGHRLMEGLGDLRITEKNGVSPRIISIIK
jgi:hypothetical protein